MAKPEPSLMDKIVSLCKRRGFVYPASEIYGGIGNTYDYGPLGVELLRRVKEAWWEATVVTRGLTEKLNLTPNGEATVVGMGSRKLVQTFDLDGLECCACAQRAATVGVIADGVPEVRRAAREELRKGATQIKMMASGGVASQRSCARVSSASSASPPPRYPVVCPGRLT